MGIPTITPYHMPSGAELPENTVQWRLDPARAVLLVHDMQQYFLQFFQGRPPVVDLVANAVRLRQWAVANRVPVAYTAQPGGMTPGDRGLLRDFWGPGMNREPAHRNVVAELAPTGDDWLLTKWRYSAFHRSDLLDRMRQCGRDQLVCCGVYAHVGLLMTTVDALTNDIQAFLVADAVADFSPTYHALALRYAAERSAMVTTVAELVSAGTATDPVGAEA